jgi:hypothetical protein
VSTAENSAKMFQSPDERLARLVDVGLSREEILVLALRGFLGDATRA